MCCRVFLIVAKRSINTAPPRAATGVNFRRVAAGCFCGPAGNRRVRKLWRKQRLLFLFGQLNMFSLCASHKTQTPAVFSGGPPRASCSLSVRALPHPTCRASHLRTRGGLGGGVSHLSSSDWSPALSGLLSIWAIQNTQIHTFEFIGQLSFRLFKKSHPPHPTLFMSLFAHILFTILEYPTLK